MCIALGLTVGCGSSTPKGEDIAADAAVPVDEPPCTVCDERIHDALTYSEPPHSFQHLLAVGSGGELVGGAALASDEVLRTFVMSADATSVTLLPEVGHLRKILTGQEGHAIYLAGETLYTVDVETKSTEQISGPARVRDFDLSPDGTRALYTTISWDLIFTDIASNTTVKLVDAQRDGVVIVEQRDSYADLGVKPSLLPDKSRVVYVAEDAVLGTWELFSVATDGSQQKSLNASLPTGGGVGGDRKESFAFRVFPDSSRVIYLADQDELGVKELYAVDPDGANMAKLSGPIVAGGGVQSSYQRFSADVAPDSSRVIFVADRETEGLLELYSVLPDGTGLTKISGGNAIAPDNVPRITMDSSTVIFASGEPGIYSVPIDGGAVTQVASGASRIRGGISSPALTPDGEHVVYIAENSDGQDELFVASVDGSSDVNISGEMIAAGRVRAMGLGAPCFFVPGTSKIVFRANAEVSSDNALYIVNQDGSDRTRITPDRRHDKYSHSNVHAVANGKLYFSFDRDTWAFNELYSYDLANDEVKHLSADWPAFVTEDISSRITAQGSSGAMTAFTTSYFFSTMARTITISNHGLRTSCRVSLPPEAVRVLPMVSNFFFSPDASSLFFTTMDKDNKFSFYRAATETCEYHALSGSSDVTRMKVSPDGKTVVYIGTEGTEEHGLYAIDVDGTNLRRLNESGGELVHSNGGAFVISPDSARVAYYQETNDVRELYSVKLDGKAISRTWPPMTTWSFPSMRFAEGYALIVRTLACRTTRMDCAS